MAATATASPAVPLDSKGKPLKGNDLKKWQRQQQQLAEAAERERQLFEQFGHQFGVRPLMQSKTREGQVFTEIAELNASLAGKEVLVRARLSGVRGKGKLVFLTLRSGLATCQVALSGDSLPREMVNWAAKLSKESIVDVFGLLKEPLERLTGYTQQDIELQALRLHVVSKAASPLPILVEDCERPKTIIKERNASIEAIQQRIQANRDATAALTEESTAEQRSQLEAEAKELKALFDRTPKYVKVSQPERLDNRVIDLRTTTNQAIFRISTVVGHIFRSFCFDKGMLEIHTPKLLGAASEGGSAVFKFNYFDRPAFLAQSPQLYKQMCVASDFPGVFEVGPVFRAETSYTNRHLCEFTGMDVELPIKEHYHEVLEFFGSLFHALFTGIPKHCARELEVIRKQFPFEDFLGFEEKPLILRYEEGIALLHERGLALHLTTTDDLDTPSEKALGAIIREKYNTDFFMLDKFPLAVRPFYTMPDPENSAWSNSYDFFMRGQEILSGAQRIHDPELLTERAKLNGIPVESIQPYIEAFRYGAPPHAGGGIGLERVIFLYLGLKNIRRTSLFPRDPSRITP